VDYSLYTFTLEWLGSKRSFVLKVDRQIAKYIRVTIRQSAGIGALIIGTAFVTAASFLLVRARRDDSKKAPMPAPAAVLGPPPVNKMTSLGPGNRSK